METPEWLKLSGPIEISYSSSGTKVVETQSDTKGNCVMDTLASCGNHSSADRIALLLNAVHGYSPEFVAAAIKAVEAEHHFRLCKTNCGRAVANDMRTDAMDAAIALPVAKEGDHR